MLEVLLRPAVLAPLVLLIYALYHSIFVPSKLAKLPIVGARKGDIFPVLQAQWRNIRNFKSAITEAYEHHKNEPVLLPLWGQGSSILLPVSETQWVADQPETVLSLHASAIESLQLNLTIKDPQLTHIVNLVPDVADECEWSFAKNWNTDTENWTEIGIYDSMRHIIGNVTNRVFVGLPCCRDPKLVDAGMGFAQGLATSSAILRMLWKPLRPLFATFLTIPNYRHWNQFLDVIRPEIERRLRTYDQRLSDPEKHSHMEPPLNDFLEWTVKEAKESGDPFRCDWKTIAGRILLLNFAAIHTSSFTITSAVIELAYSRKGCIEELREEVIAVLAAHGGKWNKRALAQMEKLDSVLRESSRLNSPITVGLSRIVVAADGVTTPSGLHIPYGQSIFCHSYGVLGDAENYPEPLVFKPFRFAEKRHEQGIEYVKAARNAFPTTSNEFIIFGHGRYACPGRFFAANEIKLLLGHLILSYEFETVQERPNNQWIGFSRLPPMKTTLRVRRRKDAS
ncbi:hypothetical protein J1614_010745 [Plenodomus biglobosus]|nr:hypothetical protein J1614_010745 [Plenodomus biglobosus]